MTPIPLDSRLMTALEARARRNRRPLDEEVRRALFRAAASFARKRDLPPSALHALARDLAGASVEVR